VPYAYTPREKHKGEWITLEDLTRPSTLDQFAPAVLPIWLRRSDYNVEEHKPEKIHRDCRPPLIISVSVREGGVTKKVPYYLRSIILHHGDSPTSGHYLTVVPTTDKMQNVDDPQGYPTKWKNATIAT